jgi:3-deoxy-7-phosphoheptulonate synthase
VWDNVIEQVCAGSPVLAGLMLESNIREGKQKLGDDPAKLEYGVSITDGCIGWEDTERMIRGAHAALASIRTGV